ncbi:MAG: ABC transporter permease subunit [Elusimicrobia bacterium]|nr:ABC transporter permease subunit [Candidatus Obscuribacterium magneticum]
MAKFIDWRVVLTLSFRTFRHSIESPIAYVVAIFFYGFIGTIFAPQFFMNGTASIEGVGMLAPWILWFVIPALTMGLISDEIRSGTFEPLSTLPLRDWEIVLGKFLGFAGLVALVIGGLLFYPFIITFLTSHPQGVDWGASIGLLAGLYFVCLLFGAMGLFASTLTKNQVVALILGMILCTIFFLLGQFYGLFPGVLSQLADFVGVGSHLNTLSRGVWDLRDLLYFASVILFFLYLSVLRLSTRRF